MTWSIVARDATGAYGIAIASRAFAVGVLCPHAQSKVGALATQALVNPHYGPRGLALLARGVAADDVIAQLTAADEGREHRQAHAIDTAGRCAAFTGSACIGWCGHRLLAGHSVAGNMLAGPRVVEDTAAAYAAASGKPFGERLLAAMDAGEAAGGDKRGRQDAALLIYTTEEYPFLDLRVDDHPEPLVELRRLYEKSFEGFQPFAACLPSRARPAGVTDRSVIEAEIARFAEAHAKSKS